MMVDDLQDVRLFDPVDRLRLFIMIHKDQLFLFHIEQVSARHHTNQMTLLIQDREVAMADL